MIKGNGIDIIEVKRITNAISTSRKFKAKIYTQSECADCEGTSQSFQRFAARFAAKEAVLKALGIGLFVVPWTEIEIVRTPSGAPQVRLHGRAAQLARERGISEILISLSHTRDYAVAQAIAIAVPGTDILTY